MTVKIAKLTALNVEALNRMVEFTATDQVTTTKTTATFAGTASEALEILEWFQTRAAAEFGKTAGPYPALHAVRRKVEAVMAEVIASQEFTRAESAKVEALRDSGELADGLAAAKARSDARAEQNAANDPLVKLVEDAEPLIAWTVGTVTVKPWVTAHVAEDAPRERAFRTRPGSHVAGRLLATSKCRRNRRR